jgi:glycosyltransferase involved in cell wall biosynthesis
VVDDACPDGSGRYVQAHCTDSRVVVHFNSVNLGVGGAVMAGYRAAVEAGADIVVKMDGDGQMDPLALPQLVAPILVGQADYAKGNRFYDLAQIGRMPRLRIVGNAMLSFLTKISSGYWDLFDPTNGYTAIHARVLARLPLGKISRRYFFETDMLFRLNTLRAVVKDIPMDSVYADEESNLKVGRVLPEFLKKHMSRLWRRYVYSYLVRDFNVGTLYSLSGVLLVLAGTAFGTWHWVSGNFNSHPATSGTVMLAALPVLIGIQSLIAFLHYDVSNVPTEPLCLSLDHSALPSHDSTIS